MPESLLEGRADLLKGLLRGNDRGGGGGGTICKCRSRGARLRAIGWGTGWGAWREVVGGAWREVMGGTGWDVSAESVESGGHACGRFREMKECWW